MRDVWKWIGIIVVSLLLVIAAMGAVFATSPAARQWIEKRWIKIEPAPVRVQRVTRGVLTRTVNAPGSIEPKTKVQISAQVAARILELPFEENAPVRKGDVLVRLDARDLQANLESAQAVMKAEEARAEGARATLEQAERELVRARMLFESKDVAQSAMDDATEKRLRSLSTLRASEHNIDSARANIARAQKDLENTLITSPLDGTIVKRNAEVGELVLVGTLNNAASVIMEVADLSTMLMKARVDESNIAPVSAGQGCRVYLNAYQGREFAGRVERVGLKRQLDRDGTGYFEVEVLIAKPEGLVLASGLTGNVDIQVQTLEGVLKVPSQAILDRRVDALSPEAGSSPLIDRTKTFARVVYVIQDGRARAAVVIPGVSDLTHTVIENGVDEGTRVITGPFKTLIDLKDDKPVKIERARAPGAGKGPAGKGDAGDEDPAGPEEQP